MIFLKILFLASTMLITACFWMLFEDDDDSVKCIANVEITNKSENNITWVAVIDTKTGNAVINEKGNELIANGSSKSFNINEGVEKLENGNFIACIEAENISEPMCTTRFYVHSLCSSYGDGEFNHSFTWDGGNNSDWLPFSVFPACPKLFAQCNSEAEHE